LEGVECDGGVADAVLVVEYEYYFLEVRDAAVDVVAGWLGVETYSNAKEDWRLV